MKPFILQSVAILLLSIASAFSQSSAFTYQGRLLDNGSPSRGSYDFQFAIIEENGKVVEDAKTNMVVEVTNGLFTVTIDAPPNVFDGNPRFLEIGVRTNGSSADYVILDPPQPITSTPYAIKAANATTAETAAVASSATSVSANNIVGIIPDAKLSSNVVTTSSSPVFTGTVRANAFVGDGSGLTGLSGSSPTWTVISAASHQASPNGAYLFTHPLLTTMILPASPLPGDLVRATCISSNGWKILTNGGQTILPVNGMSATHVWQTLQIAGPWSAIACSADGQKLIVGSFSSGLLLSTNGGTNWSYGSTSWLWMGVASSANGSRLYAIEQGEYAATEGGRIHVSTDSGQTWTPGGPTNVWNAISCSADGTKAIASGHGMAEGANGFLYTSPDSGTTWTQRGPAGDWTAVASSADGTKLAAVAVNYPVYISTDSGVTWTSRGASNSYTAVACSADGTKVFAGVYGGPIYVSTNGGLTWTNGSISRMWQSIASSADGTKLLASESSGAIYVSRDTGMTWEQHGPVKTWFGVACSQDGSKLYGAAYLDGIWFFDTTDEGLVHGSRYSSLDLQYIGNGQFIPLRISGSMRVK